MILKKVPLIDQHDKYGFWGGKFGGSYTWNFKTYWWLTISFNKLRKNKIFLRKLFLKIILVLLQDLLN